MPPPTGIHCLEMRAQGKAWMPRRLSLHLGVVWSFRDFPCECFSCPFQVSSSPFLLSLFHPLPHPPHLYFPFVPGQNHQSGKDDGLQAHFCLTDFTTPTVYRDQSVPSVSAGVLDSVAFSMLMVLRVGWSRGRDSATSRNLLCCCCCCCGLVDQSLLYLLVGLLH